MLILAIGAMFLTTLSNPDAAYAARSGGRVGGSSFRSSAPMSSRSSFRSSTTTSIRSSAAPRSSTRLYSSPSTTINKTYIYGGGHSYGMGFRPFGFSPFGGYYNYFPIHNDNLYLGLSFADSILRAVER